MKKIFLLILIPLTLSCSFDNKTGIWNEQKIKKNNSNFADLKSLNTTKQHDLKKIPLNIKQSLYLSDLKKNTNWSDPFLNNYNNSSNIFFSEKGEYKLTKKIVKKKIQRKILLKGDKFIFNDSKGIIYTYSKDSGKLTKYNFYKKKIKNFKIKLSYLVYDQSIIISDNLGYVYCIDLESNKLIWAKFFKIPFNSNIKVSLNQIFLANSKNEILVLDLNSGKKIWSFGTDNNIYKSKFINNISIFDKNIYLLNTNGSLFSINYNNKNLNWISNFKKKDSNAQTPFKGKPSIIDNNKILISTEDLISLHHVESGYKFWELNLSVTLNPIISNDLIFLITKKNTILVLETATGNLVWSNNIDKYIKKEEGFLVNNNDTSAII